MVRNKNQPFISEGNTKMGAVPSVSLLPGPWPEGSCLKNAPCKDICYARKGYMLKFTAGKTWKHNFDLAVAEPWEFVQRVLGWVLWNQPERFRWHVAGDFLHYKYLWNVMEAVEKSPLTKHLAFTKKYGMVNAVMRSRMQMGRKGKPDNLTMVFSRWPGLEMENPYGLPVAEIILKGTKKKRPRDGRVCPGTCVDCKYTCWENGFGSGNKVYFYEH
jgi:hypothetical protein